MMAPSSQGAAGLGRSYHPVVWMVAIAALLFWIAIAGSAGAQPATGGAGGGEQGSDEGGAAYDDGDQADDNRPSPSPPGGEPAAVPRPDDGDQPGDDLPLPGPPAGESPAVAPADEARGYAEPPGIEPEDVGLFVPRAVLFVPKLVFQAVFLPIEATLGVLDRYAVIGHVIDFLYNDERTAGIVPVVSVATFFGPSIGVKALHDDLGGHEEHGSVEARFGGQFDQAYIARFKADRAGGSRAWVESMVRFDTQPSMLFQGFGDAPEGEGVGLGPRDLAVESRFYQRRTLAVQRLGYTMGGPSELVKIGATGRYTHREFAPAHEDNPSIETVYDTAQLPGFDHGVNVMELGAELVVDTRDVGGATSSGVYLEGFGGVVPPFREFSYWHWGLEATGYIPLYRKTRVLVLRLAFESVEGEPEEIPFSELPRIGGPRRLRGYALDRFRDRKTAVGTVEYHYPIHQFVSGSLYLDAGRAALDYEDIFRGSGPRFGGGGGFIFRSEDSVLFTLDIAYGDSLQVYFTTDPLRVFEDKDEQL